METYPFPAVANERRLTRREMVRLSLLAGCSYLLAACTGPAGSPTAAPAGPAAAPTSASSPGPKAGSAAQPSPTAAASVMAPARVRVGVIGSTSDAGFYIGQERGYYQDEGLDLELVRFQTGPEMVPPLGTGQLDVGGGAPSAGLFNAFSRDIPLVIAADKGSHRPGFVYSYVGVRKDLLENGQVKSWADLKGRKVALGGLGNSGHYLLDLSLRRGGITWKDVSLETMSYGDMGAAFANGAIDAGLTIEPFGTQFEGKGLIGFLPDAKQVAMDYQAAVLIVAPVFARERPDVAVRFMVAYLRAVRDYNDAFLKGRDKEVIIQVLIRETTLKDRRLYDTMGLPGLNPDGYVLTKDLEDQQTWYMDNGYQRQKVDLKSVVDHQFVEHALSRLGRYQPS